MVVGIICFLSVGSPTGGTSTPSASAWWAAGALAFGYWCPWLWKLTAEKAGSFDIDKIAAASPGVEFKGAPEGYHPREPLPVDQDACRPRP